MKINIIFMFASQFKFPKVNVIFQDTFQIMLWQITNTIFFIFTWCTYSSILEGMSKFTTNLTLTRSSPRPRTPVLTITSYFSWSNPWQGKRNKNYYFLPVFQTHPSIGYSYSYSCGITLSSCTQLEEKFPAVNTGKWWGKALWVAPPLGKHKPICGVGFAQGPGCIWWLMYKDGDIQCVPQGDR